MKKFMICSLTLVLAVFTISAMLFSWNIANTNDLHISLFGSEIMPQTITERWALSMLAGVIMTIVVGLVFFVLAPLLLLLAGLILAVCILGLLFGLGGPILFVLLVAAVPLLIIGVPAWMLWFAIKKRPNRIVHEEPQQQ